MTLAIEPGIGSEGFTIAADADNAIRITGNDARGLLYGVGKFLHTSAYGSQGFTPGSWRGTSVPKMPVRGIYLATHFHNWYQVAPIEEVQQYIEDLSLWGTNSFLVWFGMEEFNGIDDPKAQAMIARLRALLKIVRDLGLNVSLGCVCNEGYANSPASLRADDSTVNHPGYHADVTGGNRIYNLGPELCPSKPGVTEMELGFCKEKFDAFKDIGLDYWSIWPYDNGGCTCAKCALGRQWLSAHGGAAGTRVPPRVSQGESGLVDLVLRSLGRRRMGRDHGQVQGEEAGLGRLHHGRQFRGLSALSVGQGRAGRIAAAELSRYQHVRPGSVGRLRRQPAPRPPSERWDETKQKLSGGFPYSEGIYEDLNKVSAPALLGARPPGDRNGQGLCRV